LDLARLVHPVDQSDLLVPLVLVVPLDLTDPYCQSVP
jgi:hypothetical protein